MSESVVYGGGSSVRVRVHHLQQAKERGEKWAMLTAYDTYSAAIFEEAGIPVMLVGDSSGNVVLGYSSTVPVTVEDLLVMTKAVTRSTKRRSPDEWLGSEMSGRCDLVRTSGIMLTLSERSLDSSRCM